MSSVMARCVTLTWIFTVILPSLCEREHKVHNIVLYPEKHSWCKTTKIEQIVTLPGYEPMTIENNVCVGACYSYSIPRTHPAEPGELIGPYCDSCQPAASKCYHVTLRADGKTSGPKTAKKRVQIITNCTCQACTKLREADCEVLEERTAELPTDLFSLLLLSGNHSNLNGSRRDDVPELLNIDRSLNASTPNLEPLGADVNDVLRKKLAQSVVINHSEPKHGTDVLKQLVASLEDPRNKFSNDDLLSLFTSASTEHVDFEKIKEILGKVKQDRDLAERHRTFRIDSFVPIDGTKRAVEANGDLEGLSRGYGMKSFEIESVHPGLGHYKATSVDTNVIPETGRKAHHHFIGEVQDVGLTSGRLTKGPHGSFVVVPQVKVEQKFHLPSDNVKPNEEGLIIQYE